MTDSIIWRVCPRFPDYEVSNCGDLRRRGDVPGLDQPNRRLRGYIDADGYLRYTIRHSNGERAGAIPAHILVAEAFIGPPPSERHEVAHNNGSRLMNTPENLRWALPVENHADRFAHGTAAQGTLNGRATITDDDVRFIRSRYREIKAARGDVGELDRQFGLCRSQIIRIARGQAWQHIDMR